MILTRPNFPLEILWEGTVRPTLEASGTLGAHASPSRRSVRIETFANRAQVLVNKLMGVAFAYLLWAKQRKLVTIPFTSTCFEVRVGDFIP